MPMPCVLLLQKFFIEIADLIVLQIAFNSARDHKYTVCIRDKYSSFLKAICNIVTKKVITFSIEKCHSVQVTVVKKKKTSLQRPNRYQGTV